MPSIGSFTVAFAEAIGGDLSGVKKLRTVLRDSGLFTTGARGVNAPDVVFLDGSRMLIASLVTDKPSLAKAAVEEFGSLPVSIFQNVDIDEKEIAAPFLARLHDGLTFEQMLAAVLEAMAVAPPSAAELIEGITQAEVNVAQMTATLRWPSGYAFFDSAGSLMSILEESGEDAGQIDDIEANWSAVAKRARTFAGYGNRLETTRRAPGDVLAAIAASFRDGFVDAGPAGRGR